MTILLLFPRTVPRTLSTGWICVAILVQWFTRFLRLSSFFPSIWCWPHQMVSMNSSSARRKRVLGYRITFPSKEEGILYLSPRKSVKGAPSGPLRFRTAMNRGVSIGPLAHPFACSLLSLIRLLRQASTFFFASCEQNFLKASFLRNFPLTIYSILSASPSQACRKIFAAYKQFLIPSPAYKRA